MNYNKPGIVLGASQSLLSLLGFTAVEQHAAAEGLDTISLPIWSTTFSWLEIHLTDSGLGKGVGAAVGRTKAMGIGLWGTVGS
jgi:hypothetical protein